MSSKKTATTKPAAVPEKDRAESGICASKMDRLFCYHVLAALEAIDATGSEGPGGDEDTISSTPSRWPMKSGRVGHFDYRQRQRQWRRPIVPRLKRTT